MNLDKRHDFKVLISVEADRIGFDDPEDVAACLEGLAREMRAACKVAVGQMYVGQTENVWFPPGSYTVRIDLNTGEATFDPKSIPVPAEEEE